MIADLSIGGSAADFCDGCGGKSCTCCSGTICTPEEDEREAGEVDDNGLRTWKGCPRVYRQCEI